MEKFEQILQLLEKKNLTDSDKKIIEELSASDEELNTFIGIYKTLSLDTLHRKHIHTDILTSYILFEKGDETENKLISLISDKIKSHLIECDVCREEHSFLKNEYENVNEHVNKSVIGESHSKIETNNIFKTGLFTGSFSFKYALAILTVFIVSYLGLFFISTSTTPEYKKNLFSDTTEDSYLTRGRTSPHFQQGLSAIEEKDYSKAIEFLSQDINEHKNEKSIFYSHYILGLTYLRASESDFLGLFKSYNIKSVDLAITNLQEAIGKNNSGSYESLKLDAHYYLGRAYLLADNRDSAVSSLQKVIEEKGKFAMNAQQLINDLEKN